MTKNVFSLLKMLLFPARTLLVPGGTKRVLAGDKRVLIRTKTVPAGEKTSFVGRNSNLRGYYVSFIFGSTKIVLKLDKLTNPKAAPFGLFTNFFGV